MVRRKKTKLKDPVIHNEKPESTDGLKKLKVGDEIMYRTPYLFDKCRVVEVDKKESIALLSNNTKVSRGILPNGNILKIGQTTEQTEIKVWDDNCELEYLAYTSKRVIRDFTKSLQKLTESFNMTNEAIINLAKKLQKVEHKYLKKK
jgi:hypothetical protein|nr:MAG TPA: hypothetical protein [Caudoviricetes sp.]